MKKNPFEKTIKLSKSCQRARELTELLLRQHGIDTAVSYSDSRMAEIKQMLDRNKENK